MCNGTGKSNSNMANAHSARMEDPVFLCGSHAKKSMQTGIVLWTTIKINNTVHQVQEDKQKSCKIYLAI